MFWGMDLGVPLILGFLWNFRGL